LRIEPKAARLRQVRDQELGKDAGSEPLSAVPPSIVSSEVRCPLPFDLYRIKFDSFGRMPGVAEILA
jgi:hypothetical protein